MMSRNSVCLLVVAVLALTGCSSIQMQFSPSYKPDPRRKVAVLAVDKPAPSGLLWTVLVAGQAGGPAGEAVANNLETELMTTYRICERGQLSAVLSEHNMQSTSLTDASNVVQIGKLAGLDGIITVTGYESGLWVFPFVFAIGNAQAKLIEVESGEVLWSALYRHTVTSIIPIVPLWVNTGADAGSGIAEKLRGREKGAQ